MNQSNVVEKKSINGKNTRPKKELFIIVLFIVLAIIFITLGITIYNKTSPKNVFNSTLKNINNNINDALLFERNKTNLSNNYKIESDIKIDISSTEPISKEYTIDQNNLFNTNITNSTNKLTYIHSLKDKKLFINFNSNINEQNIINYKYLIENSTKYRYLNNFKEDYINYGNANYFETVSEDDSNLKNYDYITNKFIDYFTNNLDKDKFNIEKVTTYIDNDRETLNKISYYFNNKELTTVLNKVKKDLKKDEDTNTLLNNLNPNILDENIQKDILKKKESITMSIYSDMFYKIKKIELTYQNENYEKIYSIVPKEDKVIILVVENTKLLRKYTITNNDKKYNISIENSKGTNEGTFEFINNEKETSLIGSTQSDNLKYDVTLDRKISNIKANKSYTSTITFSYQKTNTETTEKEKNIYITINSNITNDHKINEEVINTVLLSSLNEDEKNRMDNIIKEITERYMVVMTDG